MFIQIFVGAGRLCITPRLPFVDFRALQHKFTYILPNYEMTQKYKQFGWSGEICLLKKNQELPVGCLYRAKSTLIKLGHTVDVIFSNDVKPTGDISVDDFELDPFQIQSVKKALKCRYGVIVAPVRAGKTAISAALLRAVGGYPAWVVTDRKDLVLQTQSDISRHLSCDVGIYSERRYNPADITVTSYAAMRAAFADRTFRRSATESRNKQVQERWKHAKVIVLDECHHAASPKFENLLQNCTAAAYRIGLTATPQYGEYPTVYFESKVGSVITRIPYNTLIEKGRLAKPIVIIYNLPYAWYSTYLPTYNDIITANLIDNRYRNMFIRDIVAQLRKQGKTCFIQVNRIDHGEALNNMISESVFVQGAMEGAVRKDLYSELNKKKIHCIIGTVGKEGLNIPSLDAVINAEGSKSTIANKQKMRSLTACEGKVYGLVIDFMDKGRYLLQHSKTRLKMYQSLSGFKIKERRVPKNFFPMEGTRWQVE